MIKNSSSQKKRLFYGIFLGLFILSLVVLIIFLKDWVFSPKRIAQSEGKTNILVLGTGGEGHQGKDLSDTIIIVSLNFKEKKTVLLSLPRDLWVPALGAKINTAYEKGLEKKEGLNFAKKTIADTTGLPIHYAVRVDFAGFVELIGILGGVDVEVEKTFDDFQYPIAGKEQDTCGYQISEEASGSALVIVFRDATGSSVPEDVATGCRYEPIHFDRGLTHMDGEKALKFVRSRMGTNGENTDFARSRRQQKVIVAAKNKFLSLGTLSNPKKISQIVATLGKSIETDISLTLYPKFLGEAKEITDSKISTKVIDQRDGILYNPPLSEYFGQWVLVPKDKNYNLLKERIKSLIEES